MRCFTQQATYAVYFFCVFFVSVHLTSNLKKKKKKKMNENHNPSSPLMFYHFYAWQWVLLFADTRESDTVLFNCWGSEVCSHGW
jgi:hypothetical protein